MAAGSSGGGGGGGVPPGFRFHPTDEELLHFYLKKKVSFHKFDMEVIREVDLNKIEPWDLQDKCKIGSTPQNEWYFFSHKDRKYPTGSRTNRATSAGFWKATGRDKCIRNSFTKIGMRKTLVFYRGRAPHGQKSDWIMHEYRLEDSTLSSDTNANTDPPPNEDGWVVCRVFKKKNLFKINNNSSGEGGHVNAVMNATTMQPNMNSAGTGHDPNIFMQRNINSSINHHQYLLHQHQQHQQAADLNYSHSSHSNIPLLHHQYLPPVDNFLKPLMLTTTDPPNYDDHDHHHNHLPSNTPTSTTSDYNNNNGHHHHPPPPLMLQVKQFMSSNTGTRSDVDCESSASPAAANYQSCEPAAVECDDHSSSQINEWDRLVAPNPNPNPNPIPTQINNHLSLRSEMDFWAYGK